MTLNGAIKQLHELRSAEDMPIYYKPAIAEVINVLLMDVCEVKRGRWEWNNSDELYYSCSCCSHKAYGNTLEITEGAYHYCPNCGADMRTKETDCDYERAVEQLEHDMLYEPTFNPDDGSM